MKSLVRRAFRSLGYDISRRVPERVGTDPFADLRRFTLSQRPVLFDVGANRGQTAIELNSAFPGGSINSFEPSPSTFVALKHAVRDLPNVSPWNCALGSTPGALKLKVNSDPFMSSLLPLGSDGWGEVQDEVSVQVRTVDEFCDAESISEIDVLKTDTQGFDLEVIRGAEGLIRSGRLRAIHTELIFTRMYVGMPTVTEIMDHVFTRGFRLVSLYELRHQNDLLGWADALFVRP